MRMRSRIAFCESHVNVLIWNINFKNYRETEIMAEFVMELWAFMRERKKFWLLPIITVLLFVGVLIVLTQGSAIAPFIYTLF